MIQIEEILALHRETVENWHHREIDNPYSDFLGIACQQMAFNFELWHEEDIARSKDVDDAQLAQVKRNIDRLNQQRNDWIERMDDWISLQIDQQQISVQEDAPLNTETTGSVIDRLAIMALRIYHMQEQVDRSDATEEHRDTARQKLATCYRQQADLSRSLAELVKDVFNGRKRHQTYRALKMYNDPTMNPYLYQASKKRAG